MVFKSRTEAVEAADSFAMLRNAVLKVRCLLFWASNQVNKLRKNLVSYYLSQVCEQKRFSVASLC